VIKSVTPSGAVTEWADKSTAEAANTPHTVTGSISYSDANGLDTHTASVTAKGSGYVGTFSLNTTNIDSADSVGWTFTVSDSAIDYLKSGQTLTQVYDVKIDDGHGGTVVQTVTVTIAGATDSSYSSYGSKSFWWSWGHGNGAGSANSWGNDAFGHGQHMDGQGVEGDQMPAPHQPTVVDSVAVLGAHLFHGDTLI
jgi:VCBS repeat-containing protein